MKKYLLGATVGLVSLAATVVSGSSAMAADLPVKAGGYIAPPPAFSWSGFYVGVHGGYGWGSNNWNSRGFVEDPTVSASNFSPKTNSGLGGVQAGANYQIASWVLGIEADWSFLHGQGSSNGIVPGAFTVTGTSQIEWLATFTGRAGYAWDRSLIYVKGGAAAAGYKDDFALSTPATIPPVFNDLGTKGNTLVGWTVGAGFEYAFAPHWSAKIEYNYVDLGKVTERFNDVVPGGTFTPIEDVHHTLQVMKVGASYRFGELP